MRLVPGRSRIQLWRVVYCRTTKINGHRHGDAFTNQPAGAVLLLLPKNRTKPDNQSLDSVFRQV
jgi:hypothetical protein